jgi:hypothetical protein
MRMLPTLSLISAVSVYGAKVAIREVSPLLVKLKSCDLVCGDKAE